MQAEAKIKHAHLSAQKARLVADQVRGLHVEQALKTFSKTTLHGATIIDHWQDPEDKTMYSLCQLDLLAFKEALDNYKELDEKVRDYVRENADKMHGELEKMEDK